MATIFSVLVAIVVFFYPGESVTTRFVENASLLIIVIGLLFLLLIPLINALLFHPLQKMAIHYSPQGLELFRHDRLYQVANLFIVSFSILSFAVALDPTRIEVGNKILLIGIWVVLLGMVIDGTWLILRRGLCYLSPVSLAQRCLQNGIRGVRNGKDAVVWENMDALTEVASGGIRRHSLSLTAQCLHNMQEMFHDFLRSCKSIAHPITTTVEGKDEESFTLFFLLQRLTLLAEQAIQQKNEVLVGEIITDVAKVVLSCAQFDLSLTIYPIHVMTKVAHKASAANMDDPSIKATCSLGEIAKSIPQEVDIQYTELQPTYLSIIGALESLAKEIFRRDKKTPFPVLRQPFLDLQEIFGEEPLQSHQDAPVIQKEVKRVLEGFATLETVLHTMPPLTDTKEEDEREKSAK